MFCADEGEFFLSYCLLIVLFVTLDISHNQSGGTRLHAAPKVNKEKEKLKEKHFFNIIISTYDQTKSIYLY